jgi:gliding motility-associated-like protein
VYGNGINQINISPTAFQVDICERIYVSGWGGNVNRSNRNSRVGFTRNMPITADAFRNESQTDGSDFHIVVFEKNLNGVLYGTYFGGPAAEHVDGGTSRFDKNAIIYQAVCAGCGGNSTFPTTPGVVSQTNNSPNCNLAVLKMDIELPSTQVNVNAYPTLTGCVPLTVNFEGELINVSSFQWNFGDGNTSNDVNPVHIYEDIGIYTVQLIGIDSNSCNVSDTAYLEVTVGDNRLNPNFEDSIFIDCGSLTVFIDGPTNYPATQYLWNMGDGNVYTTQNVTHTYNVPGDYTIHLYLEDTTSCNPFDSTQFTINIPPVFDMSLNLADTTGCVPLTVDFQAFSSTPTTQFSWNFGDGNSATGPTPTHTYNATGTYTVQLTGIDLISCNLQETLTITIDVVNDSITASFSTIETWIDCDSVMLEVFSTSNDATQHLWNVSNGQSFTDSAFTIYLGTGLYSISYTAINDNAVCNNTDSTIAFIAVPEKIELSLNTADTIGCIPLEINFDAGTSTANASLLWDFGDGNTSGLFTPSYTYDSVGIYTVMAIATDSSTCNISDTAYLTIQSINDIVTAEIALIETYFGCDSLQLEAYSLVPNATAHFWSFGNGESTTDSAGISYYGPGTYNGTYIVTDTNAVCRTTDATSFTYTVLDFIEAAVSVDDTIGCVPFDVTFNNLSNFPGAAFFWDFGNGVFSNDPSPQITYDIPGNYSVRLVAVDSNSCNTSDTVFINIQVRNDSAVANISVIENRFGCDSVRLTLSASHTGGIHQWEMGNGDIVFGQNATYTYTDLGEYTVRYTIIDSAMFCRQTDTASYSFIFYRTDASFNVSDTAGCIPLEVDFENTSNSVDYIWNIEGQNYNTFEPGTYTFNQVGVFPVTLTAIDSASCNITDEASVNIVARNDAVTAFYTANVVSNCDSLLSIELNNASNNAINFFWDFETGNSSQQNPGTYQYFLPGTYTITLIAENSNLCHPLDTFSMEFTILPNIEAFFEALPNCETLPVSIDNLSPFFTDNVVWNFGNGQTSSEWQPEYIYPQSGIYTISLTLSDAGSCNGSSTYSQEIEIAVFPQANFTTDSNYYIYPDAVQFFNQSTDFDDFVWNFGDGISNDQDINPLHVFSTIHNITNCLTVSNEWCADTICKDIFIDFIRLIGVPNAFSPNNDGINDRIFVEGDGIVALNFKIYNRWGEVVFETNDQSIGWDGTYKGVPQEMEVYTYIVDALFLDGENIKLTGNITLLR